MTAPTIAGVESRWEAEGRRIAEEFDGVTSAVVVSADPTAAAQVALGIARVQARRRRVAIADMVGELAPLQTLLPRDAAHGIVDSFVYGVSLSKIAYPIDPAQNLYIMPSGPGPLDHAALLPSERWAKLASGFKEVDALLMVIAPIDAAGLDDLVAVTDGVVTVGDRTLGAPAPVLADVQLVGEPEMARTSAPRVAASSGGSRTPVVTLETRAFDDELRRRTLMFAAGVGTLVLVGAIAYWVSNRQATPVVSPRMTPAVTPVGAAAASRGTLAVRVENPGDSARAAAYSVDLVQLQAYNSALVQLEQLDAPQTPVPATTISPIQVNNSAPFHVIAGAFINRASADSLLSHMRDDHQITPATGRVVRAPFALLIESKVARANAAALVSGYRREGLPVYALLQDEGAANLYAGAFETPAQAATLLETFNTSGKNPTIVYRTGRIF